ncbi:hypothetical protein WAI453_011089 [Rhynchosporium graminicola]|uniref:Uncharacterized protein n=1 Tax=Rhynchosporium graminicola TaxID=2792576 RepID=A0A1E1L0K8_9HELO|nr:uncharacterized protein RCO7_05646 [Rhynchosporium commune]
MAESGKRDNILPLGSDAIHRPNSEIIAINNAITQLQQQFAQMQQQMTAFLGAKSVPTTKATLHQRLLEVIQRQVDEMEEARSHDLKLQNTLEKLMGPDGLAKEIERLEQAKNAAVADMERQIAALKKENDSLKKQGKSDGGEESRNKRGLQDMEESSDFQDTWISVVDTQHEVKRMKPGPETDLTKMQ